VSDPHKVMAGLIVFVVGSMNMLLWRFFCNLKDMFSNAFSIVCFVITSGVLRDIFTGRSYNEMQLTSHGITAICDEDDGLTLCK
jgi:hypothetical protein